MLTRTQVSAIIAIAVIFWIALLWLNGVEITISMVAPFGTVVGAVSLCLLIFDKWGWRWAVFRGWLINRPMLQGTWQVELQSDWINPQTQEGIEPIHCFMVIRQSATILSLRLLTAESRSQTVSAGIEPCSDGTFEISCTYRNKPRARFRHRSEVHYGALLLVASGHQPREIEGEYWTDRKTRGSLRLSNRRQITCESFEDAGRLFEA